MFTFQSIYAGFGTWCGSKKIKFRRGIFQTDDQQVANHLRKECKGIVTEITEIKKPVADKPTEEKPAKKAQEADKASK